MTLVATVLFSNFLLAADRQAMVLPLDTKGLSRDVGEGLRAALTEAIDETSGWASLDSTRRLDKLARACKNDNLTCLAKVADKRGADLAIFGSVQSSEEGIIVELQAIEVGQETSPNNCREILGSDARGLAKTATRAITQLLVPQRFNGSLELRCNVSDAEVYVDDSLRGRTPLSAAIDGLSEGTHKLRLSKIGYQDSEKIVSIIFQQKTSLQVNMLRRTDISSAEVQKIQSEAEASKYPWRPNMQPWSWGIAGLGGAMIVAGIGTGIAVWSIAAGVEQRASYQVFIFPDDGERVHAGRNLALTTNLLWSFGLLTGLSGLGLGLWDELVPAAPSAAVPSPPKVGDDEDDAWDAEVTHIRDQTKDRQDDIDESENSRDGQEDDSDDGLPDGDLPKGDL